MSGIRLSKDGFSGWIDLAGLAFPSLEEKVSFALSEFGKTDEGCRFVWLSKTNGEKKQFIDTEDAGLPWLASLAPDMDISSLTDSVDDTVVDAANELSILGVAPIFERGSLYFHLTLWWAAIVLGQCAEGRYRELRRFARTLQLASLTGWCTEVNNAYLEGSDGANKFRRAFLFSSIQVAIDYGKSILILVAFVFLYTVYSLF